MLFCTLLQILMSVKQTRVTATQMRSVLIPLEASIAPASMAIVVMEQCAVSL